MSAAEAGRQSRLSGEEMLKRAAAIVAGRRESYGDPPEFMTALAERWSITLGCPITPAQVVLCLIDLKLTRLKHDPTHQDSICDLAGYAAILQELT
jgi:hypothetical protein